MDIDHIYETPKIGIDALAVTGTIQERLSETWMVIHEEDDFPLYVGTNSANSRMR